MNPWKMQCLGLVSTVHKIQTPDKLPVQEDVERMSRVLQEELSQAKVQLQEKPSFESYVRLAKTAITSIILFNRRRPGETERLTLDTFAKRKE